MKVERTISIYDDRFGSRHVATHENIPPNWTVRDIIKRFGINDHLRVVMKDGVGQRCIQQGCGANLGAA